VVKHAVRFVVVSVGLAVLTACSTAASPVDEPEVQLVYWPLVTNGSEYRRVPYPREAGALRVLAETPVVIEARIGVVGFWPITREYLVDFGTATPTESDVVEGALEVVDGSGDVISVEEEPFVEWHPNGVGAGVELVTGEQAERLYDRYVADATAAFEAEQEYAAALAEQQRLMQEWLAEAAGGDEPPPPPDFEELSAPEPYQAYVSAPRNAVTIALSEGAYTVRLRDESGAVIEGSERRLLSLAPEAEGTGYVAFSHDRWTEPEQAHDPGASIFTDGSEDLFMQPISVARYPAAEYARIFEPQLHEVPDPSESVWVERAGEASSDILRVSSGEESREVARAPFGVTQLPGQSRGYEIAEVEQVEQADFQAIRVAAEWLPASVSVEGQDSTSRRHLRVVRSQNDAVLFLPAALPLALAIAVRSRRRR
jgi:hypothetical protein